MNLRVKCVSKHESIDPMSGTFSSTINLQQVSEDGIAVPQMVPNSAGAAIGTPNAPASTPQAQLARLQGGTEVKYNLSGALSIVVNDSDESAKYVVGKSYQMALSPVEVKEASPAEKKEK